MKVFVVSLHRIGTQSVNAMLQDAGLKAIHWPTEANGVDLQAASVGRETDLEFIADVIAPVTNNYQAISDVPIPALYDVLAKRYPEAKFIALSRSPMSWVRSARRHVGERRLDPFEKVQYWRYLPWKPEFLAEVSDHEMVEMFRRHYKDVAAYFAGSGRLLQASLGAANVGELICGHLGLPLAEFPHTDYLQRIDAPSQPSASAAHFDAALSKVEQAFEACLAVERAQVAALTEEAARLKAELDAAQVRAAEAQALHQTLLEAEQAATAALAEKIVLLRQQSEAALAAIGEQLTGEVASLSAKREAMPGEASVIAAQRDAALSETAVLAAQRDAALGEGPAFVAQRDAALGQATALGAQRDAALHEAAVLAEERDRLTQENQALRDQVGASLADLGAARREAEALRQQVDGLIGRLRRV